MQNSKLKFLILNGTFAAIIAILAQITFPLGPIPLTGQTFAVGLTATILGARNGTIAILVYILLGMIGLPVFQGLTAGIGILFGPTGGFIIGFIFNAFVTGFYLDKLGYTKPNAFIANLLGAFITLIFGMFWLKISNHLSLTKSFTIGMAPFILPALLKAFLASWIGLVIRNRLVKSKLLPR